MDGIGWAGAALDAARTRLDIAAQNLANGSTDGFRKQQVRMFLTGDGIASTQSRDNRQGALRRTGRPFDLALVGEGSFRVLGRDGAVSMTRSGAFTRDRFGRLNDDAGRTLLGLHGPLTVPDGAAIAFSGAVTRNGTTIDRIPLAPGTSVRSGFLESSNVDAISEMIDVLTAQRSFETAQKVLTAIDQTRERAATQTALVKS